MSENEVPKIDPYPEPVALSALDLKRVQRLQVDKGRDARLRRLARRNRDVAWLLAQQQSRQAPAHATAVSKVKKTRAGGGAAGEVE